MARRRSSQSRQFEKHGGGRLSRREWLCRTFLAAAGVTISAARLARSAEPAPKASEAKEIADVQALARKAGLGPFAVSRRTHFLGMGDADDRFRENALAICESLSTAFLEHFGDKGFELKLPADRLTVITLRDDISYQAFSGEDPGTTVAGHYDLDTNRLVMFDFRPKKNEPGAVRDPERVNLLALVHETTHQLCFNTGLLSRQASVPDWVSEGLATYAELWQRKKTKIGATNVPWLSYLKNAKTTDKPWIDLTTLMVDDSSFQDETTMHLAYAESWLLVHSLMKPPRLAGFQAYLREIPAQASPAERVKLAEKHLGSLAELEGNLARELKRLSR